MSTKLRLQFYSFWIGSAICIIVFVSSSNIFSRTRLTDLLRANRWEEIEKRFQAHSPKYNQERYAIALAILKAREPAKANQKTPQKVIEAFQHLITILSAPCAKASNEEQLLICLHTIPLESYKEPLRRLAAWQGSIQAERFRLHKLSKTLSSLVNLSNSDIISKKVFEQRVGTAYS